MSAAELMKEVAALSSEERVAFMKMVRELEYRSAQDPQDNGRQWPDFRQRLSQIYGDQLAPDSQSIIDEGRGDR